MGRKWSHSKSIIQQKQIAPYRNYTKYISMILTSSEISGVHFIEVDSVTLLFGFVYLLLFFFCLFPTVYNISCFISYAHLIFVEFDDPNKLEFPHNIFHSPYLTNWLVLWRCLSCVPFTWGKPCSPKPKLGYVKVYHVFRNRQVNLLRWGYDVNTQRSNVSTFQRKGKQHSRKKEMVQTLRINSRSSFNSPWRLHTLATPINAFYRTNNLHGTVASRFSTTSLS